MGRRRKEQQKREAAERLTKHGPPALNVEVWDEQDDYQSTRPLYGRHWDSDLPWEQDVAGFEVAYDNGVHDDLSRYLESDPDRPRLAAFLKEYSTRFNEPARGEGPYHLMHDDEIRVFELQPGTDSDPLRGCLLPVNIMSERWEDDSAQRTGIYRRVDHGIDLSRMRAVQYTAISYCWDQASDSHDLDVGGSIIQVSSTVKAILEAFRHPEHRVRLWIDQVCIDQGSRSDKESQIKLMGAVYRRAYNTLIWLGEEPEDGAFHLLQSLAYGFWGTNEKYELASTTLAPMVARRAKAMRALIKIFKSSWFNRTWIVQELALSFEPYLKFGARTMPWQAFGQAATYLNDFDVFSLADVDEEDKLSAMVGVRSMSRLDDVRIHLSFSLVFVLEQTRNADVTIPIDKIYGVMAMCDNIIAVDYGRSVSDVLEDVARQIFRTSTLATLLSNIDHERQDLPSWVTDWSQKRLTTPIMRNTMKAHQNAGGRVKQEIKAECPSSKALIVRGLVVDTISHCSAPFECAQLSATDMKANDALCQAISFLQSQLQPDQHADFKNFCATIVAGQDETGLLAAPESYVEVLSLLCDESTGRRPSLRGQIYSPRQITGYMTLEHLQHRVPKQTFWSLKQAFRTAMLNRKLAWTQQGQLALVPRYTKPGDTIIVIDGVPMPYLTRHVLSNRYRVVGECFVESLMDGAYYGDRRPKARDVFID